METINFNNIVVKYKDHTISIAQHKKVEEIYIEEIMVFGDHVNDEIIRFSGLNTLIEALNRAKQIIDMALEPHYIVFDATEQQIDLEEWLENANK